MPEFTDELIEAYADALGYSDKVPSAGAIRIPQELIENPVSKKEFVICKMKETIRRSRAEKASAETKETELHKDLEIE